MILDPTLRRLLQEVSPDGTRWPKIMQGKKRWSPPPRRSNDWLKLPCQQRGKEAPGESKGNLPLGEYRFWQGSVLEISRWTRCRACRFVVCTVDGVEERKDHTEHFKCSIHLTSAYSWLNQRGECVVCQKKCKGGRWGVPLCSLECQEKWMFDDPSYPLLFEALAATNDEYMRKRLRDAREQWEKEHPGRYRVTL